jgi:hypothetical protein
MENELGECLQIKSLNKYTMTIDPPTPIKASLNNAIRHQNIIGWENLLQGYVSSYWIKVQSEIPSTSAPTGDKHHGTQCSYVEL